MMVSDGFFRACWQKVAWVFYNIPAKTWEACSALTPHLSPKTAMASRSCFFSMLRLCWLLANCLREKKTNTAWMLNNLNPLTCQQFGSQLHLVVSKNGWALGTPTWMHYMFVIPWSKHNDIRQLSVWLYTVLGPLSPQRQSNQKFSKQAQLPTKLHRTVKHLRSSVLYAAWHSLHWLWVHGPS